MKVLINAAITTRLVDTVTTPMLLKLALSGKLDPAKLITHSEYRIAFDSTRRGADYSLQNSPSRKWRMPMVFLALPQTTLL
jgi:hypothetical protein